MENLVTIELKYGTDKSPNFHDYLNNLILITKR